MKLISIDLVIVLFVLFILNKFKLNTKFIKYLLKNVQVFLPPSDRDYQQFMELKQNNNGKKIKGVFRRCDIYEYITHIKEENFLNSELLIFFYQSSFLSLLLTEIKKYFLIEEDMNISSFYAFITIFYIIGRIHSNISENNSKKEKKIYYGCLILILLITYSIYYFEILKKSGLEIILIKIDQDSIMKIIDDRIHKILDTSGNNDKIAEVTKYSNDLIIFLYFFIFSFSIAINFGICKKEAVLDDVLLTNVEKNNNLLNYTIKNKTIEKFREEEYNTVEPISETNTIADTEIEKKTLEYIGLICKIKIILRIFLMVLLFDQLFKNFLLANSFFSDFTFRTIFVPIFIIIDVILTSSCLRYHCMNYLLGNYFVMVEAVQDPKRITLDMIRLHCNQSNNNFWKFFSGLFINTFLPLLIYFSFINRADIVYKLKLNQNLNLENYTFFTSFLETILYITYTGFILSRCIVSVIFFSYYQVFVKNSKVKSI